MITDPARLDNITTWYVCFGWILLSFSGFSQLPGQAHECELAYVRPPPDEDDRQDAKECYT